MGEKFEADKDYSTAHNFFQKCREAAKASWDKHGEGEACGKIGSLYVQTGDYEQSISYLQSFAMLANDTGNLRIIFYYYMYIDYNLCVCFLLNDRFDGW